MYKVTLLLDANYRVVESHTEFIEPIKVPSPPPQIELQPSQIKMYEDMRVRSMLNSDYNVASSFAEQYKSDVPHHAVWDNLGSQPAPAPRQQAPPPPRRNLDGDWKLVQARGNNPARQGRR